MPDENNAVYFCQSDNDYKEFSSLWDIAIYLQTSLRNVVNAFTDGNLIKGYFVDQAV